MTHCIYSQVWWIFDEWDLEMTSVDGLEGYVYRTTLDGVEILLVHGQHPSPRSFAYLLTILSSQPPGNRI